MEKEGFHRDHKVIGDILKNDPALKAAVRAEAESIRHEVGGFISEYETDRFVAGVVVHAHEQARDGVLTKAVGSRGKTLS